MKKVRVLTIEQFRLLHLDVIGILPPKRLEDKLEKAGLII